MIIFLDIDGVLNSENYFISDRFNANPDDFPKSHLDPIAIGYLNDLVGYFCASIVLSASARFSSDTKQNLKDRGLRKPILDVTPSLGYHIDRGEEIKAYLSTLKYSPPYLILDDDTDFLEDQKSHFVHINNITGFDQYHLHKAIRIGNTQLNQKK